MAGAGGQLVTTVFCLGGDGPTAPIGERTRAYAESGAAGRSVREV